MTEPTSVVRAALADVIAYEPGKPEEEVQRELGLERIVKLASNEGAYGPFPAALEALERAAPRLNRYPDGGTYRLRTALAERYDLRYEDVAVGAGADGVIDCLSQATLDPGDEIVCGWPSFPSYVIYALKMGATPMRVPLRDDRYDLDALLGAIGPRTKLVYVCHPNNPTGTMNRRAELDAFLDRLPEHVLPVLDQAYLEYIDDDEYADGIEEYFKRGRRIAVLRTFSKIYGLAGLRVGYAAAPPDVIQGILKVRRAFDVTADAQEAALASLDVGGELERRRQASAQGRHALEQVLGEAGFRVAGPAVANFVFADTREEDAGPLFDELLRHGVIVRPTRGFGAPGGIRVTVGTPEETAFFAAALTRVRRGALAG